jgi:hypothetical protein
MRPAAFAALCTALAASPAYGGEPPPDLHASIQAVDDQPYELDNTYRTDIDETRVSLNSLKLIDEKPNFLKLSFSYNSKGKTVERPKQVRVSVFTNLPSKALGPNAPLSFDLDGTPMPIRKYRHNLVDATYHTYDVDLPLAVFMNLARAKELSGQVGDIHFKLSKVHAEGLAKFVATIPAAKR